MSPESIVLVARFSPNNKQAENKLLSFLAKGSEFALESEPGTLKYAFATSRDEKDTTVYCVEQYADQGAFDHHVSQPHIQQLAEWLKSGEAGEPQLQFLNQLEGFDLTRPEVATHPDPLLLLTDIQYKPGKVEAVLPCWRGVFERTRDDEEGALHWQLARDSKHPDRILVAHTYESRDYLLTVHAAGKELKELQAFVKDIQVSMKPVFLKIEGGYLHR
ncbi:hypothetical protein CDV31_016232 [Fusarium ambrosium]|uniref:ABM domain-containing protein n=1 Tax=Fusarium ambrosium TaxID=131363 RepID=A0A428SCN9_9HYPO|nr:hypothetical protein CDV31_016232 [Fusarium ambrosium]